MRKPGSWILAVCALTLPSSVAQGQVERGFMYPVKFVCGKASNERVVARGEYFTAINVNNPNDNTAGFKKKVAIALPREKAGRVSTFVNAKLGPDEAFEIDCRDILRHADSFDPFLKGFVVIESPVELDIVVVYTAAGSSRRIETMDVERVVPRRLGGGGDGQPDLIPVPGPNNNFCNRKELKLIVTVKNQGTANAGPSTTTVDFGGFGAQSQPTPALAAGASVDVVFDIPGACFNPDCEFRIRVDSGGVVAESNEVNNTASGTCAG
jgi:hypothetical protein